MLSNTLGVLLLPFRSERELHRQLHRITGFWPSNIAYYKVALMHKSLAHQATDKELRALGARGPKGAKTAEKAADNARPIDARRRNPKARYKGRKPQQKQGRTLNNERLEFLGDAILDAAVGDIVFRQFPTKPEGFLTDARAKLVKRETLGILAKELGINALIKTAGRTSTNNNFLGGNAFEALVGALYLDHGYDACMHFWQHRIMGRLLNVEKVAYKEMNFKSKLLEWAQHNRVSLTFRLGEQAEQGGTPVFAYTVVLEGVDGSTAQGFTKKESQQKASEATLHRLRADSDFVDAIFAAKTARTKMEETPVSVAPDPDQHDDFIIANTDDSQHCEEREQDVVNESDRRASAKGEGEKYVADNEQTTDFTDDTDPVQPVVNDEETTDFTDDTDSVQSVQSVQSVVKDPGRRSTTRRDKKTAAETDLDDLSFDDIVTEKSRDQIIAEAEALAFSLNANA